MRLDELDLKPEDYAPKPPTGQRLKIGIVGCGAIANSAHLPAYRDFGYEVVACMDIDSQAVEAVRHRWSIPRGSTSLCVLLDDPEVEVVDLAVHANVRPEVLPKIAAAGKPILSQKPLAMDWASAKQMVRSVEQAGVPLMVNQQARWAPAHRAMRVLIDRGVCGPLYSVAHVRRSWQDHPDRWWRHLKDFSLLDHGVHYIDLARYFTGRSPDAVSCATARVPGQHAVSPLCHSLLMHFDRGDLLCTEHFNNIVPSPAAHSDTWYLDGVDGSIVGTQQWVGGLPQGEARPPGAFPNRGPVVPGRVRRQHGRDDDRGRGGPRAADVRPRQPEFDQDRLRRRQKQRGKPHRTTERVRLSSRRMRRPDAVDRRSRLPPRLPFGNS